MKCVRWCFFCRRVIFSFIIHAHVKECDPMQNELYSKIVIFSACFDGSWPCRHHINWKLDRYITLSLSLCIADFSGSRSSFRAETGGCAVFCPTTNGIVAYSCASWFRRVSKSASGLRLRTSLSEKNTAAIAIPTTMATRTAPRTMSIILHAGRLVLGTVLDPSLIGALTEDVGLLLLVRLPGVQEYLIYERDKLTQTSVDKYSNIRKLYNPNTP